ncbi:MULTISPECIES: hypothetical protein [unclassified Kitasatospora]|uniref:hypothetical protein n=1 Tax=unclassified Kitasatospora TaxID=2633591 RepID=UPI0037FFCC34
MLRWTRYLDARKLPRAIDASVRRKTTLETRQEVSKVVVDLVEAVERSGINSRISRSVRYALWRQYYAVNYAGAYSSLLMLPGIFFVIAPMPFLVIVAMVFQRFHPAPLSAEARGLVDTLGVAWGWLFLVSSVAGPVHALASYRFGTRTTRFSRRYYLPRMIAQAIVKAERASTQLDPADSIRELSKLLRECEKAILSGHRTRGTIGFYSHRRAELKRHARLVVARLRKAEARLDSDTYEASREVMGLLAEIAENYVAGRLGKLLPQRKLNGLDPVRDRSELKAALRYAVGIAVFAGAAWGAGWLGVPTPYNFALAAVPAALVVPAVGKPLFETVTARIGSS